jgi:4-amino-4-deoxy-L-arabinose transferase-like glycosyltransferase
MPKASASPYENYIRITFLVFWLAIIALWVSGFTSAYFTNPDAYDYAQMGREIARSHGMSTKQVFPRHLSYFHEKGILHQEHLPNLYRYPLPILANVAFQFLTADPVQASVLQCGTWFLLSIPVFFLLAQDVTSSALALVCSILYVAHPGIWQSSYNGMTESLSILMLLAVFYLLAAKQTTPLKWAMLGILSGLASLTRPQFLYIVIVILVFFWIKLEKPRRLRAIIIVALSFFVTISPWILRNIRLIRDPFFSFETSRALVLGTAPFHSDLDMQLHAPFYMSDVLPEYGSAILNKLKDNLRYLALHPTSPTGSHVYLAIALIILERIRRRGDIATGYARFRLVVLVLLVVNTLVVVSVLPIDRLYYPLFPLIIIPVVRDASTYWQQAITGRYTRHSVAFVLIIAGSYCIARNAVERPRTEIDMRVFQRLNQMVDRDRVIASDISYKTALLSDVLSIRLPGNPRELLEIDTKYMPIDYVVLSPRIPESNEKIVPEPSVHETYAAYRRFVRSKEFLDRFEFVEELPGRHLLYKRDGHEEKN